MLGFRRAGFVSCLGSASSWVILVGFFSFFSYLFFGWPGTWCFWTTYGCITYLYYHCFYVHHNSILKYNRPD